jgi:RimJ/RimL family protein N-acetyltransferase
LAAIEIGTQRLRLLALTLEQLRICLQVPERLEQQLGFPISPGLVTEPVRRALNLKVDRMSHVAPEVHPWHTYWLLVIAAEPRGVGLIGFKGEPDRRGEVEIGYGIVPSQRNRGYTTEATRALIAWAFRDAACSSIVADSRRGNLASNRVLSKVGMHVFRETEDSLFWQIDRATYAARRHDGVRIPGHDGLG